jgi:NAD(P)-dependent dehydrogenase (short-subunit alcohol dehydrogenase family)
MRLQGKVALVTGAGSGIGRATSILFGKEGAKVVAVDIDQASGNSTVQHIKDDGGNASFVQADVGKSGDVMRMIESAIDLHGQLNVLFNNAGINPWGTVVDTTEEVWDKTIAINLKGVFLGCKFAIPHMIRQGGGSIINTASVNGLFGLTSECAYDASKGGVVLLTKATAIDFGSKNIRVNCVCPGITDTPLLHKLARDSGNYDKTLEEYAKMNFAFQRMIKPSEVANTVLFLASDESSGVTGAAFVVDGGYTAI